jgi:DNA-binding transcriptional regulator YhcF (GntR family)
MDSIASPAAADAPLWRGIASAIERAITTGSVPIGSRLPGEHELAGCFGASRHTIVRAVRHLAALGLVERRQGIGTFIITTAQPIPRTTRLLLHPAGPLTLSAQPGTGQTAELTAVARERPVGYFRVMMRPSEWKSIEELADIDVLTGARGWTGCRRHIRVGVAPTTAGASGLLHVQTEITDEFTGNTCSIDAHLSADFFALDIEHPLPLPGRAVT